MDGATVEKRPRIHTKFQEGIIFGWGSPDVPSAGNRARFFSGEVFPWGCTQVKGAGGEGGGGDVSLLLATGVSPRCPCLRGSAEPFSPPRPGSRRPDSTRPERDFG